MMIGRFAQLRNAAAEAGKARKEVKIRRWKELCSIGTTTCWRRPIVVVAWYGTTISTGGDLPTTPRDRDHFFYI